MVNDPNSKDVRPLDPARWLDRHGDSMYRYALSRLRDPESAEEVVQETLFAGLRGQAQYTGEGPEAAWLMGILKRKVVDHVRRRNRTVPLQGESTAEDLSETLFDHKGNWRGDPRIFGRRPEALLERDEFWEIFRMCLAALPRRQADAFSLREVDGLASEEICKILEISSSNLWVLVYRARARLSRCIQSHGLGKGGADDA